MYQYVKQNYPPLIIFAAVAAMMFTSCQKTLNVADSRQREIRFNASSMTIGTKAFTEVTNETLQTSGFKAAAVKDADNSAMFNKAVAYSNGVYTVTGEHYYFPSEGTLSFYGVYPADEVIAIADDGKATLTYVHNSDDDLIGASKANVASQSDAVVLDFKHLLAQVSISVKTDDANVVCKLYSITINGVNGGTYSFADDAWTLSETKTDYAFFSKTEGQAVTETAAAVGSAMSFMPGEVTLNAKWKCYDNGGQLLSDKDETLPVTLTKGTHTAITLLLPVSSNEIKLATSVTAWVDDPQELTAESDTPQLLSGVFTVKAATESTPAKKVKFTKGNLYWNGSAFRCEANQYDYPTAWDSTHVGHFFWSKTASVAYAKSYSDDDAADNDTFFAADGGVFDGFTVLSKDEWDYLISNSLVKESGSVPKVVTIDGKKCAVLKPDAYSGAEVESTYTAEEWATAEASCLVALPFAGYRNGSSFLDAGSGCVCWSSVPSSSDFAYYAIFSSDGANAGSGLRNRGYSVRLVSVQ